MATQKSRKDYFDSEEGKEIKSILKRMVEDDAYQTSSSYSANTQMYPDSQIPFIDKHMAYLVNHPSLKASTYVDNLKLVTKVRR